MVEDFWCELVSRFGKDNEVETANEKSESVRKKIVRFLETNPWSTIREMIDAISHDRAAIASIVYHGKKRRQFICMSHPHKTRSTLWANPNEQREFAPMSNTQPGAASAILR